MKLSRAEVLILSIGALFLAFTAGKFLAAAGDKEPLQVETEGRFSIPWETAGAGMPEGEQPETVNINTAGAEELQSLPGIGETLARRILQSREEQGPFRFPEELTRVEGIGEATLAELLPYITVEEENP